MELTIDKCLEKLAHERQCFIDECYQNDGELEAYDMAISTMRKFQKIEEIINAEVDPIICNNFGDVRKVQAIREVIEDENDD